MLCKSECTQFTLFGDESIPIYVEGKWYDVLVRPYKNANMQKINGGGYESHIITDEQGKVREESKAMMRVLFYYTEQEQRDAKLKIFTDGI